ncbi:alpha/beta-hydrolase [Exidia glandulosa HHB12029]|uniref:Carboxylic ester hydrolase n=1 Tax=Exidia glandulosa HHB12029 TaxID=1314781 RepID=A0A165QXY0_EXIGL|nr:alpha/beta-hydrolase [Exidia glandulosa HHB12029]
MRKSSSTSHTGIPGGPNYVLRFVLVAIACSVVVCYPGLLRVVLRLVSPGSHAPRFRPGYTYPRVTVGNITYEGLSLASYRQEFFGGIPYALPPIAELRFRRPVAYPQPAQHRILSSQYFGKQCMQSTCNEDDRKRTSEDCLTLSILRPTAVSAAHPLPVMVWIHGGGFHAGNGNYNGSRLVGRSVFRGTPVIFVSLNYRLAAWGFPQGVAAHDEGILNLGLRDQVAALEWVRDNIRAFGGDPQRITLYGESAGAISVSMHFFNPHSASLFHRAIFISGAPTTMPIYPPMKRGPNFAQFASQSGCTNASTILECLRSAPVDTLLKAHDTVMNDPDVDLGIFSRFPWTPTIDGDLIPDDPRTLMHSGPTAQKPYITGCNLDEGTIFTPHWLNSSNDVQTLLAPVLGHKLARDLVHQYNNTALRSPYNLGNNTLDPIYGTEYTRGAAIAGDLLFHGPRKEMNKAGISPLRKHWAYHFTDDALVPHTSPSGVYHGITLGYFFGTVLEYTQRTDVANLVAEAMDYFVAFATTGNPNDARGQPRPYWPAYEESWIANLLELHSRGSSLTSDTYRWDQLEFLMRSFPAP